MIAFLSWLLGVGMVGMGGFGLLAALYDAPALLAWLVSIIGFLSIALATFHFVLVPLARQEANSLLGRESYRGLPGYVCLGIPASGTGQISFTDRNGARVVAAAVTSDGRDLPSSTPVSIVDVTRDAVVVKPISPSELPKE